MSAQFFGGVGLRPTHYPHILSHGAGRVQWFEAISENFMDTFGRPRHILRKIREKCPISLHGVSMSLGSPEGINQEHLERLKSLANEVDPFLISDHLCWSKSGTHYSHDLLPVKYNKESLTHLVQNIQRVQEGLKRSILIENISAYVHSNEAEFTEWDFITEVCKLAGCKILLDINNVYVNAVNFNFDPKIYLQAIPANKIGQIHLAGFTDMGDFLFDTHSKSVAQEVWDLFKFKARELDSTPILIEWDDDIPDYSQLEAELLIAKKIWQETHPNEGADEIVL